MGGPNTSRRSGPFLQASMTKRVSIHLAIHLALQLAVWASVAGCVQPATVPDSTRLEADEGIVVYDMKCGPGIAWGQVFRSGARSNGYTAESRRTALLSCRDGAQIQSLKAGRYFVGKVGFQGVVDFSEEAATQFDVAAGKLNYIGHITLPSSVDTGKVLIADPFVNDRRDEALAWLGANQSSLQQQYEFVTALAQSPSRVTTDELTEENGQSGVIDFTVILKLRVAADGSVREGRIARSSGNAGLNQTALSEAVRSWRVAPASEGGTPVEQWGNYSVTYRRTH
jgi:TonB family protein